MGLISIALLLFGSIFLVLARNNSLKPLRALNEEPKFGPNQGPYYGQPEQVAISYAGNETSLWITWITFNETFSSIVEYGINDFRWTVRGNSSLFVDGGLAHTKRYVHRVILINLRPGITYQYHVGSEYGWSSIYRFNGLKERQAGGFVYAVYGDLGNVNARSLGKIQQQAQRGEIDVVLHVGDIAYNLDTDDGKFGDEFGRQLEPVAAYVPYMVVVGNHESAYNFSHYVNRYTMPQSEQNFYYSFNLGAAHFIVLSTEFYFFTEYGYAQIANQWRWLNEDLKSRCWK